MEIICVITCLMVVALGKLLTQRWINLLSIFSGIYMFISLFSSLRLFGLYESSYKVYLIITLGVFSFGIGYIICSLVWQERRKYLKKGIREPLDISAYTIREGVLKVGCTVLVIFTAKLIIDFIVLIQKGYTFYMIRNIYFGQTEIESSLSKTAIDSYVYLPIMYVLLHIASVGLFVKIVEKNQKIYECIIFGTSLIYCICTGGRNLLFSTAIEIIVLYALFKKMIIKNEIYNEDEIRIQTKKKWSNKKLKRWLIVGIALLTVVVFYLTFKRSLETANEGQPFYITIYKYFCGGIPYTDYYLNRFNDSDFTYGCVALSSFIRPITQMFLSFFDVSFPDIYEKATGLVSSFYEIIRVSNQFRMNGFIFIFYYFYSDFGYVSVVLYSIIFGIVVCLIEKKVIYNPNLKFIVIYLFVMYLIVFSFARWYLAQIDLIVGMYLIQFVVFKKRRRLEGV